MCQVYECRYGWVVWGEGDALLDFDFEPNRPAWSKKLAVFDLETTGLDLQTSRIVTAAVAVLNANGEPIEVHEWLVNPGIEIPEAAANVHGITTEMAKANGVEPSGAIAEIIEHLRRLGGEMALVAFNAPYDFTILQSEATRYGITPLSPVAVIDPLVLDRQMVKFRSGKGSRTLTALCRDYEVELVDAHNSTADAIAAGRLAQRQASKFPALSIEMADLHAAQVAWSDEQSLEFEKWLKQQDRPDYRAVLGWPIKIS
jgi:DNA polymerase-3 subunit epsilon